MPDPTIEALEAKFAAEDAQDASRPDVAPSQRDIVTFDGFAGASATPREIDGVPYGSVED